MALMALVAPASAATLDPVAAGVPGNGRAWELVTPGEPMQARIELGLYGYGVGFAATSSVVEAVSASGDRVAYRTAGTGSDASFGSIVSTHLAERGSDGWSNRTLTPPLPEALGVAPQLANYEGAVAFNADLTKAVWVNPLTRSPSPYGLSASDGLFSGSPGPPYTQLSYIGVESIIDYVTPNLDRVFFHTDQGRLVPADAGRTGGTGTYEYSAGGLHLLGVNDDGTPMGTCGPNFAGATPGGDEVFITFRSCSASAPIYMRAGGHTSPVSASQCTLADCGPDAYTRFLGVTPDGSTAYLLSDARLTDVDNEGKRTIYRYDVASGVLSPLFPPSTVSTGVEVGSFATSTDGSRVYFSAEGQLLPGQGAAEAPNLYLVDASGLHCLAPLHYTYPYPRILISPDGRYAVFDSPARLAPGDVDASVDVYRYDADAHASTLVSGGVGGSGNGAFDATIPKASHLLDDGRLVAFATDEPLLPQDHNDKEDVYEWTEGGGIDLVSGGTPGFPADFVGATADGRTILFRTGATLLPRDHDLGELDVYAARIGGGFPEPLEPVEASECAGAGCPARSAAPGSRRLEQPPLKRRLALGRIDEEDLRRLARTGATKLLVEVPAAGRLTVTGRSRRGASVVTGSARPGGPGSLRVRIRLTPTARRALAAGGSVRARLYLDLAGRPRLRGPAFTLPAPGPSRQRRQPPDKGRR